MQNGSSWTVKRIENLISALKTKKQLTLAEIFSGLGIRLVGAENARVFAHFLRAKFGTFRLEEWESKIETIDLESLTNVDGIGDKVAQQFYEFIHSAFGKKLFADFVLMGIELVWPEEKQGNLALLGKHFVITGTFSSLSRDELKKRILDQGGKVLSAVSKNVDVLCVGENPGSKLKTAQELGVAVWDEARVNAEFKT